MLAHVGGEEELPGRDAATTQLDVVAAGPIVEVFDRDTHLFEVACHKRGDLGSPLSDRDPLHTVNVRQLVAELVHTVVVGVALELDQHTGFPARQYERPAADPIGAVTDLAAPRVHELGIDDGVVLEGERVKQLGGRALEGDPDGTLVDHLHAIDSGEPARGQSPQPSTARR